VRRPSQEFLVPDSDQCRSRTILRGFESHASEHHLRVPNEILVNLQLPSGVSIGAKSVIFRLLLHAARPLLQEKMSVVTSVPALALNAVFGKRRAPSNIAHPPGVLELRILFVHRVAARDQGDQPARTDHVEDFARK